PEIENISGAGAVLLNERKVLFGLARAGDSEKNKCKQKDGCSAIGLDAHFCIELTRALGGEAAGLSGCWRDFDTVQRRVRPFDFAAGFFTATISCSYWRIDGLHQ